MLGLLIFEGGYILLYCGTPTFWQRGLWDSCFQNPSESSERHPRSLIGIFALCSFHGKHKTSTCCMQNLYNLASVCNRACWFCLFDLILYVPSTIFQLNRDGSSWVEPVLSYDKCDLRNDHSAGTLVRLEPPALILSSQALYH